MRQKQKQLSPQAKVQVGLRLTEGLRRLLENESQKAKRSLNQEIVWRLSNSIALEQELNEAYLKIAEQENAAEMLALARGLLRQAKELNERGKR
jgi:hypothetical protein